MNGWKIITLLFSWSIILRNCEHMYFFSSGKPVRVLIWTIITGLAYLYCGFYLLPFLVFPLPFTYKDFLKPNSRYIIKKQLQQDIEQILSGNDHNLSNWSDVVKFEHLCQWDIRAVKLLLGDYNKVKEEIKKNNGIDGCKKLVSAWANCESQDDWTKRNLEILMNLGRAIGYVPTGISLHKKLNQYTDK